MSDVGIMSDVSVPIKRTCTDVTPRGSSESRRSYDASGELSLSTFRTVPAYVLLGDPGVGKTTELRRECAAMGENALMLSVRDFITFDVASRSDEWQGKTLFIDGLDEARAGREDARGPLDGVRRQIDRLGRPDFRMSCREADWLGSNDWQSLKTVSPDSEVSVLRLDPMNEQSARELLASVVGDRNVGDFTRRARRWGVEAMLSNPLTSTLLAEIVTRAGQWPDSRLQTFEMACRQMAEEHNDEHLAAVAGAVAAYRSPTVPMLVDAAGYLCCLTMLSDTRLDHDLIRSHHGRERRPPGSVNDAGFDDPPTATGAISPHVLRCALATKLFTSVNGTFDPRHRQIAEFLASRHLAKLIDDGLPARRVIALMTSPSDGGVPTSLRGLSAWLAAHSSRARHHLIGLDPVGVGLYGDIHAFTPDDRKCLLDSLDIFSTQASLFNHEHNYIPGSAHGDMTVQAFRSLVTPDTISTIENLLNRCKNLDEQSTELPCNVTAENYRRRRGNKRLKDFLVRILPESN